jgi:hypothetical protein
LADLKQKKAECLAAEARAKSLQEKKSSMVEHLRMVIHDGETRRAGPHVQRHCALSTHTVDLQLNWKGL